MKLQTETEIRNSARQAYERSRAVNALALGSLVALPAIMVSIGYCPSPLANALCGLGLGVIVAAARFIGLGAQAALRPGLIAGLVAFSFPLVCHGLMSCPSGMCMSPRMRWIPFVAAGAAFFGGMALRFLLRGGSPLVAGVTALLLGSLGSLTAGFEGPLWTAAGLMLGRFLPSTVPGPH